MASCIGCDTYEDYVDYFWCDECRKAGDDPVSKLKAELEAEKAAHAETLAERDRIAMTLRSRENKEADLREGQAKLRERAERAEREADERRETGDALQIELNRQM